MRPESSWKGMAGDVLLHLHVFSTIIIVNWTESSVINIKKVPVCK